uniref:Uncharacterized protein n=1 Tax=Arundo donax TaxID=35708 RepID=A0A0A9E031_ARUDO
MIERFDLYDFCFAIWSIMFNCFCLFLTSISLALT